LADLPRHVDGSDFGQTEIPQQSGIDKRRYKATRCSVNMDVDVDVALNKQVVYALDILVLARVRRSKNRTYTKSAFCLHHEGTKLTNTNGVLIAKIHALLGINNISVRRAIHISFLDVKVAARLLPTHLNRAVHDHIGLVVRLALGLALVLPEFLLRENAEHDGFAGANGGRANGVVVVAGGRVEEAGDHGDAAVLDVGRHGVFFVVDEVLGEGVAMTHTHLLASS
jgi:hypothetical protein